MTMSTFSSAQTPTISPDTQRRYLDRYHQFEKRFALQTGRDDLTPDEVVAQLILLKPSLSMDSWRTYKNAAAFALKTLHPSNESALEALSKESSSDLPKTSAKTSGRKGKQVTEDALLALSTGLRKRAAEGHRHAGGLLHFLTATLATGLRPIEWCYASLSTHAGTGRPVLRVRNAKNTNGRGNGEHRELFIDELADSDMTSVRATLSYCAARDDEEAERIILALRNELGITRSSAIVLSKRPKSSVSLYSFRHQFIANAKATFSDPVLIAALVGHNSTSTAFEHYGKRRYSSSKVAVYPTPDSVEAVQKISLETYKQFVADRAQRRPYTM